jgi:cobalt-zinc-cadmium efflux system membrane fusion protein
VLLEVGDPSAVWVVADVFERDLVLIQEGAMVDVEVGTVSGALHGRVASIGSVLNVGMRRAPVYIALDDFEARLRPGLFARATIKGCAAQVIELPASAVLIKDGRKYVVYVKEGDGAFARREITVGPSIDGKVQVVSGLQPGDEVAVKGALLLDGASEQLL